MITDPYDEIRYKINMIEHSLDNICDDIRDTYETNILLAVDEQLGYALNALEGARQYMYSSADYGD